MVGRATEIGLEYLTSANRRCNGRWTLVLLSGADIVNVVLPSHNHPIVIGKVGSNDIHSPCSGDCG